MGDVVLPHVAYAEANWSRWIVKCPSPYCRSALQLPRNYPEFGCWDCGTRAPVVWPTKLREIEKILSMRPDPITRNWVPGESLFDLIAENLAHGVVEPVIALAERAGGTLQWWEIDSPAPASTRELTA